MAGTQSVWADDPGILGIPRSRQTVAIIYPQDVSGLQDFPSTSGQGSRRGELVATPSPRQCSARAAQDIWEHHRPAVGSSMHALGGGHSTSEKLNWKALGSRPGTSPGRGRGEDAAEAAPPPHRPLRPAAAGGLCPTGYELQAIGRQMSHSLSESTRQITPPIRSGHAPPSTGSRKSSQSVHPSCVLTW